MRDRPESLTIEQSSNLIEQLKKNKSTKKSRLKSIRNTTMALLMLDAGLRCGEVVRLARSDLMFNGVPISNLQINSSLAEKAAVRTIPVSPRLAYQIELMITSWWLCPSPTTTNAAFLTCLAGTRLTVRQVQRIISQASCEILGHRTNPHMLRHTFASNLMRKTNIRVVQTLLGHKCLSSTQIYTHPDAEDLRQAIHSLPQ